ncbi:MAG: hypothetical protein V2J65_03515 [Desulfobacteraceae bacterium]|nr:hypothetical protein [Desulfobacteraceae bacterium]
MELIVPHLDYRGLEKIKGSIHAELKPRLLLIVLAVIGLGYSLAERKWLALYPAGWALIAYLSFRGHNPIWYHHQMLVTIPAGILAAFGIYRILYDFWQPNKTYPLGHKALIFLGLILIGALLSNHIPNITTHLDRRPSIRSYGLDPKSGEMLILRKIQSLDEDGAQMATDMPIFAFRARLSTPVELAWVSTKRLQTGLLTEQDFIAVIEREKPIFVLNARFYLPELRTYLENNQSYEEVLTTKIDNQKSATLYRRIIP